MAVLGGTGPQDAIRRRSCLGANTSISLPSLRNTAPLYVHISRSLRTHLLSSVWEGARGKEREVAGERGKRNGRYVQIFGSWSSRTCASVAPGREDAISRAQLQFGLQRIEALLDQTRLACALALEGLDVAGQLSGYGPHLIVRLQ